MPHTVFAHFTINSVAVLAIIRSCTRQCKYCLLEIYKVQPEMPNFVEFFL